MEWITMSTNPSEGISSTTGTSLADSHQPSGQSLFSWAANRSSNSGPQKIRVTILCARSLVKRDLFRLPDPFVKVSLKFATRALTRSTFKKKISVWFYKQHWKFSCTGCSLRFQLLQMLMFLVSGIYDTFSLKIFLKNKF